MTAFLWKYNVVRIQFFFFGLQVLSFLIVQVVFINLAENFSLDFFFFLSNDFKYDSLYVMGLHECSVMLFFFLQRMCCFSFEEFMK